MDKSNYPAGYVICVWYFSLKLFNKKKNNYSNFIKFVKQDVWLDLLLYILFVFKVLSFVML